MYCTSFLFVAHPIFIEGATPVVGMNYILMCNTSDSDPEVTLYQWRKNGTVIQSDTRRSLFFSPLSLADAGRYSCNITMGYSESKEITLNSSYIA